MAIVTLVSLPNLYPRGSAIINFKSTFQAKECINKLQSKHFGGSRPLHVTLFNNQRRRDSILEAQNRSSRRWLIDPSTGTKSTSPGSSFSGQVVALAGLPTSATSILVLNMLRYNGFTPVRPDMAGSSVSDDHVVFKTDE